MTSSNPDAQQFQRAHQTPAPTLYDALPPSTLSTLERLLLHSLANEPSRAVRKKSVDTVSDVVKESMRRGRPWHALQSMGFAFLGEGPNGTTFANAASGAAGGVDPKYLRETAYLVFAGCPNLVLDLQTEAVVGVYRRGLEDACVDVSVSITLLFLSTLS